MAALLVEHGPEVGASLGVVRPDAEREPAVHLGLGDPARLRQLHRERDARVGVVRAEAQRLAVVGHRQLALALAGEREAEPEVGGVVALGDGQGAAEQRGGVLPGRHLRPGEPGQRGEHDRGGGREADRGRGRVRGTRSGRPPDQHHEDADQRQVGVAIGPRLLADLDQADHRHQHAEVPEPAGQQVRAARPQAQGDEP